jgi:hypothetical protein
MRPALSAALAMVALSACSALVPSTAARLAALDPLTADPAALKLVVVLPPGLAISSGSAMLTLSADRGGEHKGGSFQLADRPAPANLDLPKGATARGFAIAGQDVDLGVGGCAVGDGPAPDATGSVLIKVREDGPFLPLIADGRLSDLLGAEVLAAIKPCQAAE